jgi:hypothetical protein
VSVTPPVHDAGMALTFRSSRTGDDRSARRTNTGAAAPTQHFVYFDVDQPDIAHTRIDCSENGGLIELVETYLGRSCDDPMMFEYVADVHGLVSPAHLVHQARPCAHCTLVAAPYWLSAA